MAVGSRRAHDDPHYIPIDPVRAVYAFDQHRPSALRPTDDRTGRRRYSMLVAF